MIPNWRQFQSIYHHIKLVHKFKVLNLKIFKIPLNIKKNDLKKGAKIRVAPTHF